MSELVSEGAGGGGRRREAEGGYRTKNKNPTRQCGEKCAKWQPSNSHQKSSPDNFDNEPWARSNLQQCTEHILRDRSPGLEGHQTPQPWEPEALAKAKRSLAPSTAGCSWTKEYTEMAGKNRKTTGFVFFKVLTQLRVYVDDCRCMA